MECGTISLKHERKTLLADEQTTSESALEDTKTQAAEGNSDTSATDTTVDEDAKYEQERSNAVKLKSELNSAHEQLEALQRSQRSAEENQKRDLDRLKKLEAEFDSFKKGTFLELEISKENKYEWHPNALADVRNSVDFNKVTFSEMKDGKITVDGLDLELKRIAQEKPYLLKPKDKPKTQEAQAGSGSGLASGAHPYGSSNGGKTAEADLLKKYKIA